MRRNLALLATALLVIARTGLACGAETLQEPTLDRCLVTLKTDREVPAQDPGVLESIDVIEGETVRQGYLVARIDATDPKMKKEVAEFEQQAADQQAKNDINVRYAHAQALVAQATLAEKKAANTRVKGTISNEEIRKLELDLHRTILSQEQAEFERTLAALTAQGKEASVRMEQKNIERREVKSPIDGRVEKVLMEPGEWVSPGDTILRIIDLSVLHVSGPLKADDYDPRDVMGRPVTVEINVAYNRKVTLEGKVTFVGMEVLGGEYAVRAEVQNRREEDHWVLRPGLTSTMVIHINAPIVTGN